MAYAVWRIVRARGVADRERMHVSLTPRLRDRARLVLVPIALTMLALAPPQIARGAPVYQVPATISGDCTVDVTQPLLNWIASVPDNSVLSFSSGACYRIEGTLEITNRHGLTFDGNGASFRATSVAAARPQWRLVEGGNFVLRDMTIDGGDAQGGTFNAALQHSHGVELMGPSGVDIDNVTIANVYGDCVYVGQGWYSKNWSSNIHVHDGSCARSGRMGVAVTAGRNVLVERMSFSQIGMTVFDVEPNGAGFGASGVTFANNHVRSVEMFDAVGDGPVDSITVSGNTITGGGTHMVAIAKPGQRHSNIAITGNVSDTPYANPGSVAIDIVRVDGVTVIGNSLPLGAPNMALVDASESCGVDVSGNTYSGGVAEARIHPYSGCAATPPLVTSAPAPTSPSTASPTAGSGTTSPAAPNAKATPTSGDGSSSPGLLSPPGVTGLRVAFSVPGHQKLGIVRRRGLLVRYRENSAATWSLTATRRMGTALRATRLRTSPSLLGRLAFRPKTHDGTVRLPIPRGRFQGTSSMVIEVRARVRAGATSVLRSVLVRVTNDGR
jgi:hypothetical protein